MRKRKKSNLGQNSHDKLVMTREEIGNLIKKELKLQNKDQTQLANELDMDYSMINSTINVGGKWSFQTMNKILDHLGIVANLRVPIDD